MRRIVAMLILLLALAPGPAVAGEPGASPSTDLRQERATRRPRVLPLPPASTVARDAEQAREELAAPARRDELLREGRERAIRRPDLDYSVTNAIQADRAIRALRR